MAITKVDSSMYEDVSGANNLVKLDANAKIPAGAATNLTNLPGPEKSSSDPTISSNKTLGTQWLNTSSGEMYVCTDATAGANVWTNVGAGTGNIQLRFQGEAYGYDTGGRTPTYSTVIQKYSFTSDGNSTDVADMLAASDYHAGTQSQTYSYTAGGRPAPASNTIEKHQFATTNNATDVGDLPLSVNMGAGVSGNDDYGYHLGGNDPNDQMVNPIQRYSYTSDGNGVDVGDMTRATSANGGHSDWTASYGYSSGGRIPTGDVIERFAFGSSVTSSDVGDMAIDIDAFADHSSDTHGYCAGGYLSGLKDHIQKFAFASSGNSTDIGNLTAGVYGSSGSSSTTHGYSSSGNSTTAAYTNRIEKYSHSSDGNATDIGDCLAAHTYASGTHV